MTLIGVTAKDVPGTCSRWKSTPLYLEELRRLELADAPVGGQRCGYVAEREVGVDPFRRPLAPDAVLVEQRVNL